MISYSFQVLGVLDGGVRTIWKYRRGLIVCFAWFLWKFVFRIRGVRGIMLWSYVKIFKEMFSFYVFQLLFVGMYGSMVILWRACLLEMCFRHSFTLCLVAWGSVDERHETHSNTSLYCIFGSYVLELFNLKDWLFCSPSIPLAYTGVSFLINKISL